MTRVLIVDDQELVRSGVVRILRTDDELEVVGERSDGDEVIDAVRSLKPDIVLMDVRMRRVDGAEATRRLGEQEASPPPVLVLTTFDDDETLSAALRAGAAGFLLKDTPGEDLIRAVKAVAAGDSWLDPSVTGRVLAAYRSTRAKPDGRATEGLTAREVEVLKLMARGLSNAEIAAELIVGEVTVKTHVSHIFTKLGVRDRSAAVVYAFDHGIVDPAG